MEESLFENYPKARQPASKPRERPETVPAPRDRGDGAVVRLLRAASRRARTRR
ncbi:MAG: hypothetical protein V2A58_02985 [Planctomycetota bacterium]